MRHKDPELKKRIAQFVEKFYGTRSRMPSTAEIAKALRVAKSTAYTYLAETIRAFPPAVLFEDEMRDAGFVHTWYRKLTSGIVCLHVGEKPI